MPCEGEYEYECTYACMDVMFSSFLLPSSVCLSVCLSPACHICKDSQNVCAGEMLNAKKNEEKKTKKCSTFCTHSSSSSVTHTLTYTLTHSHPSIHLTIHRFEMYARVCLCVRVYVELHVLKKSWKETIRNERKGKERNEKIKEFLKYFNNNFFLFFFLCGLIWFA